MLVKPHTIMEFKSEIDSSGSDPDTAEQLGADGKDDDSQLTADVVARDDGMMDSAKTESPSASSWTASPANASPEKASLCPYCLKVFRYRSRLIAAKILLHKSLKNQLFKKFYVFACILTIRANVKV